VSDTIIEAEVLPAALPDDLQEIAIRYVAARRQANESTLEAAEALAEARTMAAHREWYKFLEATNTSEDLADRLLTIWGEAQKNPEFRESVVKGWLPQTQAALVARPSTPPEAKAAVITQAAQAAQAGHAPPSKREVEKTIQTARGVESKPRTGAGFEKAPAATPTQTINLIPMAPPAPARAPAVLASIPAAPAGMPPMLFGSPAASAGELPPMLFGAGAGAAAPAAANPGDPVRLAEAAVALLKQALVLAEVARDAARRDHPVAADIDLDDAAVEQAARALLASADLRRAVEQAALRGEA
jgi:hypothetical protein